MANDTIEQAIEDIRNGRVVIVVDDENRENEGDLVMAAEKITPAAVNFMAREGRGLICVPMEGADLDRLGLSLMVNEQKDNFRTAFTVSVDAAQGITTGISAYDRAKTIQVMVGEKSEPVDLVKPGHLFPLRYCEGGVLRRAGHTEASVDLARLAGLKPAGVICEILREDGTMARIGDLGRFARKHDLTIISIADLIRYRREHEKLVERLLEVALPTRSGDWKVAVYRSQIDDTENLAFIKGKVGPEPTLVRVHSECLTGDVFGSLRCDCGEQLQTAMDQIDAEGKGVLLYMRQEGRGIGLVNKLRAYQLQDQGLDTVEANEKLGFPADLRDYGIGAQILADLGLRQIRLLTNNPKKIVGLEGYGLQVVDRVAIEIPANQSNVRYLETKQSKLGHLLTLVTSPTKPKKAVL